ncbi:MAG: hypothetical protein JJU26_13410 [Oceanicaulis sp.]|nr:hypothetical protein [Oceanicaulis sp.]
MIHDNEGTTRRARFERELTALIESHSYLSTPDLAGILHGVAYDHVLAAHGHIKALAWSQAMASTALDLARQHHAKDIADDALRNMRH